MNINSTELGMETPAKGSLTDVNAEINMGIISRIHGRILNLWIVSKRFAGL
jgi:hypothetical protein